MLSSRFAVLVASAFVVAACGGGTPQPKAAGDSAEHAAGADTESADKGGDTSKDKEPAKDKEAAESADAGATAAGGGSGEGAGASSSDDSKPKGSAPPSNGDLAAPPADDPWMAPHQMPPKDVLKTMRGAMGRVNACYRAAKKRQGGVSGDVKIKFVISHEGAVRVWRDEESTMSDPECTKCVGDVIQTLKFPTQKSPGDAWGIYSINFGG